MTNYENATHSIADQHEQRNWQQPSDNTRSALVLSSSLQCHPVMKQTHGKGSDIKYNSSLWKTDLIEKKTRQLSFTSIYSE